MSALPPKADLCGAIAHVCFGPIADIVSAPPLQQNPPGIFARGFCAHNYNGCHPVNSTPVSVTDRQMTLHGRIEWPPSNVKPKPPGRSTVFAICTRAPALVTFRTVQSMHVELPRTILAPLKTRERVTLRRSCMCVLPSSLAAISDGNWRRFDFDRCN